MLHIRRDRSIEHNKEFKTKNSQIIFDKGIKLIHWVQELSFQQMLLEQLDIYVKKNFFFTLYGTK